MAEEKQSFEARLSRLNEIVAKIEGSTLPLDEAIKLFQEGQALIKGMEEELNNAVAKIEELTGQPKEDK